MTEQEELVEEIIEICDNKEVSFDNVMNNMFNGIERIKAYNDNRIGEK